ncbi:Hypothetical predicted protein, partial [Scomber scombrus]
MQKLLSSETMERWRTDTEQTVRHRDCLESENIHHYETFTHIVIKQLVESLRNGAVIFALTGTSADVSRSDICRKWCKCPSGLFGDARLIFRFAFLILTVVELMNREETPSS